MSDEQPREDASATPTGLPREVEILRAALEAEQVQRAKMNTELRHTQEETRRLAAVAQEAGALRTELQAAREEKCMPAKQQDGDASSELSSRNSTCRPVGIGLAGVETRI